MLANSPVVATIPCVDLKRARRFYGVTLGLPEMDLPIPDAPDGQPIGAAFQSGGDTMIFVYRRDEPATSDHTAAGWWVSDFDTVVDELMSRGITFDTYPNMPDVAWDARGVASAPDSGYQTAWFKDPEGNVLAINTVPA
ncbi:MAG: VOC family protein [Candidatus Promineifilaceae bacterium]|jgi:catechol 2,3-dioxygenase-like lactoylglutathione lyase family enzyme